jgi:glutamyl-tRNA synthetase
VEPRPEDLVPGKRTAEEAVEMLQTAIWALEGTLPWGKETVETAIRSVAEFRDWPVREVTVPLIAAVTGERVGPPLFESVVLLGLDLTRMRLMRAIEVLGGLSKKKAGKLEKDWNSRLQRGT